MNISMIRLNNYQCHRTTEISDLDAFTLFVGPNGGGKSALFDGLRKVSRLCSGTVDGAFGPPPYAFSSVYSHFGSGPMEFSLRFRMSEDASDASDEYLYHVAIEEDKPPARPQDARIVVTDEYLDEIGGKHPQRLFDRKKQECSYSPLKSHITDDSRTLLNVIRQLAYTDHKSAKSEFGIIVDFVRQISHVVQYRMEPTVVSQPSLEPDLERDTPAQMRYDGAGVPSVLAWMKERDSSSLKKIINHCNSCIPHLVGIDIMSAGVDRVGFALVFDDDRGRVLAPNVSSGTLCLLGLTTLLCLPQLPEVACIEEPENGLTPDAQHLICKLIADRSLKGDSQFMVSSHSPFVVVDTWNSGRQKSLRRVSVKDGASKVEPVEDIVRDHTVWLQKDQETGERRRMGLKNAEDILCGRYL